MSTRMAPSSLQDSSTLKHFALKKAFLYLPIGSGGSMAYCLKNASGCLKVSILRTFNIAYFARALLMYLYTGIPRGTLFTSACHPVILTTLIHTNGLLHP